MYSNMRAQYGWVIPSNLWLNPSPKNHTQGWTETALNVGFISDIFITSNQAVGRRAMSRAVGVGGWKQWDTILQMQNGVVLLNGTLFWMEKLLFFHWPELRDFRDSYILYHTPMQLPSFQWRFIRAPPTCISNESDSTIFCLPGTHQWTTK
jgi:hypothetical protein